jgi:hypothetical protein
MKGISLDGLRLLLSFAIIVIGIVAVIILVLAFGTSPPSTVGTGISAISTLVGFLAGHTTGAAGKERAEDRANALQGDLNKAIKAAPDAVSKAIGF